MADPHHLQRFLDAQGSLYPSALAELQAGHKRSHWMWFVFPQLVGLGHSETAVYYGIRSRAEAAAYLEHAVLGDRLKQCTLAVLAVQNKTAREIFGYPDDLKFASCMTLFAEVADGPSAFQLALDKFFGGKRDGKTLELLAS